MKLWQKLTDLFDNQGVQQEMLKRYKDTILSIVVGSKVVYGMYRGMNDENMHLFRDANHNTILLADDTEYDVFVPRFTPGAYNTEKGVVFVTTNPARQWKRGLCSNNTEIIPLQCSFSNTLRANQFSQHIYEVLDESKQRFVSLDEARDKATEIGSYAINREFSVCLNPVEDTDTLYLFYKHCIIGTVDGNTITLLNPVFKQEVLDTQRSWCPNYGVN
jgi:hypothetical protein